MSCLHPEQWSGPGPQHAEQPGSQGRHNLDLQFDWFSDPATSLGNDSYVPTGHVDGVEPDGYVDNDPGATGSKNEAGMNFGVVYNMNAVGIGLGYEMIKGGDDSSLNAFTISFSYAFGGGNSADGGE